MPLQAQFCCMTQMNLAEAKAKLSQLVDEALDGGDVVIARAGQPAVRLVPVAHSQRETGFLDLTLDDDFFFAPLGDDELAQWE